MDGRGAAAGAGRPEQQRLLSTAHTAQDEQEEALYLAVMNHYCNAAPYAVALH